MIAGAGRFAIYLSILVFLIGYTILAHLYIKPAGTRPYASTNLRLQIGVPKAGKEHRHVGNTYVHRDVLTGREEDEFVSAFTLENREFTWAGDSPTPETGDIVNLGTETVVPGFLDIHAHPSCIAMTLGAVPCTSPDLNSIKDMIDAQTSSTGGKGPQRMDRGLGYDESKLAEHRALTSTRALAGKKIGPVRFPTTAANRSPYYLLESEPCG